MKGYICFLFLFLVGCSPSLTEQADQLILEGKYVEASNLLKESQISEDDLTKSVYNYEDIYMYNELVDLFEDKRYRVLIEKFNEHPIQEEIISQETMLLIEKSFNAIIQNKDLSTGDKLYQQLNDDAKQKLNVVREKLNILKKEKEAEQKQLELDKKESYMTLMKDQKYDDVATETYQDNGRITNNFYNLSSAYDWFYNNDDDLYVFGLESMPEHYLKLIENPYPEVQELMDSLMSLIELRKSNDAKSFGVIIGMTAEEVLKSSWGEPESKNVTTSTFGIREQWVYGVGNYLYFKDGILVSIQTRN